MVSFSNHCRVKKRERNTMPREIVTETSRDKLSGRAKKLSDKAELQPCRIQVETCPAPECNLSTQDVKLPLNESKKYMKLFKPAFQRVEQTKKSQAYVYGLLGHVTRKNVEQMALGMGARKCEVCSTLWGKASGKRSQ